MSARWRVGPQHVHGETVREQQVVRCRVTELPGSQARRVNTHFVAEVCAAERLVQRGVRVHAIAEGARDQVRVVAEPVRGLAIEPAASVFEMLRQVPVVQRDEGLDVPVDQCIEQSPVEIDAVGVQRPVEFQHPRPRDREAIGIDAEGRDEIHVLLASAPRDRTRPARWSGRESCPVSRRTCPRYSEDVIGRPLDLERRRRHAEDELRVQHP